jgi:trehalose synthase-fused probable maltokinase
VTSVVSEQRLVELVSNERWFGAKAETLVGAQIVDHAVLREEGPRLVAAVVELRYGSGNHDLYQLVLGDGDFEASADPAFAHELLKKLRAGGSKECAQGFVCFESFGEPITLEEADVRPLGADQSNSSLVIGDALLVKLYRRLEAGINPELELLRFFSTHGFANAPALRGSWWYAGPVLDSTLGVVQDFVADAVDGWSLGQAELSQTPDAFVARARRLGEVIGEMHAVLASDAEDPAFAPEESGQESLALLTATVDEEIDRLFLHLPDNEAVAPIAGYGDAVRDLLRNLTSVGSVGRRIRHHGDLHLGQVLWNGSDWFVIDFEGEPVRTLPERRAKRSPLRDVAGMLRSFTYAASVAGGGARAVEERLRVDFLAGYETAVAPAGLLPQPEATERLLRIFELEKAVYELRYELNHRPDWVSVPVAGIVRLLEEAA